MSEEHQNQDRKTQERNMDGRESIIARGNWLQGEGVPESMIPVLSSVAELFEGCLNAAYHVLGNWDGADDPITNSDLIRAASAIMSRIAMQAQQPVILQASGMEGIGDIVAPPGYPGRQP